MAHPMPAPPLSSLSGYISRSIETRFFWPYPVLTGTERGTLLSRISALSKTLYPKRKRKAVEGGPLPLPSSVERERASLSFPPQKTFGKTRSCGKRYDVDSHSSARGVYFCGKRRFLFLVSFRLSKVDKKQNEMWIDLSLQTEMERQDRKGGSKKVYTAAVQKTLRSDLGCCIAVMFRKKKRSCSDCFRFP